MASTKEARCDQASSSSTERLQRRSRSGPDRDAHHRWRRWLAGQRRRLVHEPFVNETRRQLARARYLREASMEQSVFIQRLGVAVPTTVVIMLVWAVFVAPGGAP